MATIGRPAGPVDPDAIVRRELNAELAQKRRIRELKDRILNAIEKQINSGPSIEQLLVMFDKLDSAGASGTQAIQVSLRMMASKEKPRVEEIDPEVLKNELLA